MDNRKTGALIAETRKELHLTQKDLAERLHVSIQAVSKWERGLSFPDVLLLEPLAELLGLSVSELLAGERNTPTQEQPVPEQPPQEQLVPERLVQESIRISTAQLGGRIQKWRKRFLSTAALLCAIFLLLGGFYLYRHTKLLPRNETTLSQQEPSAETLATAVASGGDVVLYDLVYADNITGEALQLELWTAEGLAKTWPLFAAHGDDPRTRPRHETIALSAGVDFGRDGAPDTFRYGAALHSGIFGTVDGIHYGPELTRLVYERMMLMTGRRISVDIETGAVTPLTDDPGDAPQTDMPAGTDEPQAAEPAGPAGCGYTAGMNILTRPIFRVMCAGLLAGAIVGCGNKGPLVLPAKPPVTETVPVDDADTGNDPVEQFGQLCLFARAQTAEDFLVATPDQADDVAIAPFAFPDECEHHAAPVRFAHALADEAALDQALR